MQPLSILAHSDTGTIPTGNLNLFISRIRAFLHTQLIGGVCKGWGWAEQHTALSNIISEGSSTSLNAFVVTADNLLKVSCRTFGNTFVHVVILKTRSAVVGAFGVSCSVLEDIVVVSRTADNTAVS